MARRTGGEASDFAGGDFGAWTQHVAQYVISDQYVPQFLAEKGIGYDPDVWVAGLLTMCSQYDLLLAVTAATGVAHEGGQRLVLWTERVLSTVDARLAKHLRAALTVDEAGPDKVFMARQPLLLALKLILAGGTDAAEGNCDPFTVVTLLSHHAAREPATARHPDTTGRRIAGQPTTLAMEIVQNSLFHSAHRFGDLLARTHMLWTSYEHRLVRYPPRAPLRQMLLEATGIELDDMLTIAFAVFAHTTGAGYGDARRFDLSSCPLPQTTIDAFLARFSSTEADLAARLDRWPEAWAFLSVEETPLWRIGETLVAVWDERLLQRRFTSGLYWLVHDYERDFLDEHARLKWTQTYSELVEIHAKDLLARVAPPILGGESTFFAEEQLRKLGGSAVDCGIDFGDFVLLADVVQHQMTVQTRMLGEVAAFEKDMKAMVLKKARQLDGSARALLDQPDHPAHPLGRRPLRIFPIVVEGADFPVNPYTVDYAREKTAAEGLLTRPECAPLMIVTLDELEMLEALVQTGNASADEVLRAYSASGARNSLRNFIIVKHGGAKLKLSGRCRRVSTR